MPSPSPLLELPASSELSPMTGFDYLLISQFFVCLMLALVFYVVWKSVARQQYVLLFCVIYLCGLVAGFLNALVSSVPTHAWYWILYAAVFQVILGLLLAALRLRAGNRWLKPWHLVLLIVTELAIVWFSLIQPHIGLQMALVPYCAAIVLALAAQQIRHTHSQTRLAEWWAYAFMLLYALSLVGSGTAALLQGADFNSYYLGWYNRFTFIVQPTAFAGIGIFIVLMLADDMAVKLRELAVTDQLTGLLNRRGFENAAKGIIAYTRRHQTPLTIVAADMDSFKKINDQHSHYAGDLALQAFAQNAHTALRKEDLVARIGGEEFAILLVGTPIKQAQEIVERLRVKVADSPVPLEKGKELTVTCSFGMVALDSHHGDVFSALREADEALYQAKNAGRNRSQVFQPKQA